MGMFDETARHAAKHDPGPFNAWVLSHEPPPPPLAFERWDDARRLPLPGGPDRTDDLVAILRRTDTPDAPSVSQIVEVQTKPEPLILPRLGVYGWLLVAEKLATTGVVPQLGVVVIHLTGGVSRDGLTVGVAQTQMALGVRPLVINLEDDDAATSLAAITAGRFGLCVLSWVPLMKGGGEPTLIEEWKRVALTEPDVQKRVVYRDLALVFAELTRGLVNWQRALEGWQMQESQYIKRWMNEGRTRGIVEAKQADLLRVLQKRFQGPLPETVRLAVEGTNDPTTLDRWLDAAATANTLAEFRAAMPLDN